MTSTARATPRVPRPDLPALTTVRGIAAWWVVAYHTRTMFPDAPAVVGAFLAHGYLAVDMFFVLSGFVIALNYTGRLDGSRAALGDFAIRRFARLYPLHLLLLLAALGYVGMLSATGRPVPGHYTAGGFLLSAALLQNWGLTTIMSWNVPAWSISTEMFAYLTFPVLALGTRWAHRPVWLLAAAALALAAAIYAVFVLNGTTRIGAFIPQLGLARCAAEFALGTIVHEVWRRSVATRARPWLAVAAPTAAAALVAAYVLGDAAQTFVMPLLWAALVLGIALAPSGPLAWPPLVYVGEISYATYLAHYLMFIWFKLLFVPGALAAVPVGLAAGFYLAVLAASVLLYHAYERPAQRWIMARWRARRVVESAPAG